MNYSITYAADYRYEDAVADQHNALRVRPAQEGGQRLDSFDVTIDPAARLYTHNDYFGTGVVQFAISDRHDHLAIRAESRVRTVEPDPPPEPDWESLADPAYRERGAEYLGALQPRPNPERIAELVAEAEGGDPLATLRSVCTLVPDRFEYRPGVTYVGSTVDDLLRGGAGVCQDFVHLALAMLRGRGIAARYVSGYLFDPGDGGDSPQPEASAEVDTHAWIEALLPRAEDGAVWVAADPTNRALAGADHVKIGHGRSYADVPPIRGVYRGSSRSEIDVNVTMTRLDGNEQHG